MTASALLRRTFLAAGAATAGLAGLARWGRSTAWAAPGTPVTLTFVVPAPQDPPADGS